MEQALQLVLMSRSRSAKKAGGKDKKLRDHDKHGKHKRKKKKKHR